MTHTLGRWHDCPVDEHHANILADHNGEPVTWQVVATAWGPPCPGISQAEYEANARLLAAAPELLGACRMALEWLENACRADQNTLLAAMPNNCGGRNTLRAAITAAERR